MALISKIECSNLNLANRLDPDHYSLRFIPVLEQIKNSNSIKLRKILSEPVITGHTPSTNNPSYYDPGIIKFIKTDNLREDRIDATNIQMLSEQGNSKIANSELRKDDIIITIIGATEHIIGRAAKTYDDLGRANINQNIALIRANIPSGYLVTFLNTKYGGEQLIRLSRQTGQVNLNCREVEELSICLFSNRFMDSINSVVSERHALFIKSEQLYSEAEKLLLSQTGLLDWQPTHTLTYTHKYSEAIHSQRLDAEFFQPKYKEMFGKLKETVSLQRLGNLVTLIKGVEVGSEAYTEFGIPFLRVSNMTKHGLDSSSQNYLSESLYGDLCDEFEPKCGELLLSKDATPGIAFYLEEQIRGIISSGILRLRFINSIPSHYLELVLNTTFIHQQIEQSAGGSVIIHWKPSEVRKTPIPRIVPEIENGIANLVKESHACRRQSASLLDKAKRAIEVAIESGEDHANDYL